MTTFYIAEVQNAQSFRKAEAIEAKDITSAKRIASRSQTFQGTVLLIGKEVNAQGFILNPIARKIEGKWHNAEAF